MNVNLYQQEIKSARFKKFQCEYIIKVLQKGYLLNNQDYYEMLQKAGYIPDKINIGRFKNIMSTEIVKQDTENKLMKFYIESGYSEKFLKDLLDSSIQAAKNKENGSVLFQIYQHLESKHFPESKTKVTQQEHLNTDQELTSISRTITKEVNE